MSDDYLLKDGSSRFIMIGIANNSHKLSEKHLYSCQISNHCIITIQISEIYKNPYIYCI
jgi:hypothetical protein